MAVRTVLSPRARLQYALALEYLAARNLTAAEHLAARFENAFRMLEDFPLAGARHRVAGTRRLIVSPYILIYRVTAAAIDVLEVRHGRQREAPVSDGSL